MTNHDIVTARALRKTQTKVENILWSELRAGRLFGYKFRRQHVIKPYIVDFVCLKHNLIIELDGNHHQQTTQRQYDVKRTEFLSSHDYRVIRFKNEEIYAHRQQVLQKILFELHAIYE